MWLRCDRRSGRRSCRPVPCGAPFTVGCNHQLAGTIEQPRPMVYTNGAQSSKRRTCSARLLHLISLGDLRKLLLQLLAALRICIRVQLLRAHMSKYHYENRYQPVPPAVRACCVTPCLCTLPECPLDLVVRRPCINAQQVIVVAHGVRMAHENRACPKQLTFPGPRFPSQGIKTLAAPAPCKTGMSFQPADHRIKWSSSASRAKISSLPDRLTQRTSAKVTKVQRST